MAKITLSTAVFLTLIGYFLLMYVKLTYKLSANTPNVSVVRAAAPHPTIDWEDASGLAHLAQEVFKEPPPSRFLPQFKNPCWKPERRLFCLPYFYLAGMPKCGTTDLWQKITQHPMIVSYKKEPHWWTRKRIGFYMKEEGIILPPSRYYQRWSEALSHASQTSGISKTKLIVGDGSASTLWDNNHWHDSYPNHTEGPPHVIAEVVAAIQPNAKIIVILRNPTERLYSDYLFFAPNETMTAENFHSRVERSISMWSACLREHEKRTCTYSYKGTNNLGYTRIQLGMYSVYISDWLKVFPRKQLLVLSMDDWRDDCQDVLRRIYGFLELSSLTIGQLDQICRLEKANTRSIDKELIGPMLNETKTLLDEFYKPYNKDLTDLLKDTRFLWR